MSAQPTSDSSKKTGIFASRWNPDNMVAEEPKEEPKKTPVDMAAGENAAIVLATSSSSPVIENQAVALQAAVAEDANDKIDVKVDDNTIGAADDKKKETEGFAAKGYGGILGSRFNTNKESDTAKKEISSIGIIPDELVVVATENRGILGSRFNTNDKSGDVEKDKEIAQRPVVKKGNVIHERRYGKK